MNFDLHIDALEQTTESLGGTIAKLPQFCVLAASVTVQRMLAVLSEL